MSVFYTESIEINELPKYLSPEKVDYEIIFSKDYNTIKGKLTKTNKIQPFKLKTNDSQVYLYIKIGEIVVKKVHLGIHEEIITKTISLKSTISQTCEEENNICSFELKFNIYSINKCSNEANLLSLTEIERLSENKREDSGYFIYRVSSQVSVTSKNTIDLINNPSKINNQYIKKAMEIFKRISNQNTEYPRLVYRDIMVELYEFFLKNNKEPDRIIKEISRIFGTNVGEVAEKSELLAFYHIYEALVRKSSNSPGYDKIQHFSYSLGKRYTSTKIGTDFTQYGAEVWDLINGGTMDDTKSDMEANNLGEAYGWNLYKKYHPVRAAIRSLD